MSSSKRRKVMRRKKIVRSFKRTMTGVLLAPGKMPRIAGELFDRITRYCEISALVFVSVLILHMASPMIVPSFAVVICAIVFALFICLIGISDYQDKLVEYEMFGFKV